MKIQGGPKNVHIKERFLFGPTTVEDQVTGNTFYTMRGVRIT